jgi:hypothetical protein
MRLGARSLRTAWWTVRKVLIRNGNMNYTAPDGSPALVVNGGSNGRLSN